MLIIWLLLARVVVEKTTEAAAVLAEC